MTSVSQPYPHMNTGYCLTLELPRTVVLLTDYAPDYPLLPVGKDPPKHRSVTGKPLNILGRKLIKYDAAGVSLFVIYYVCDVPFCLVSVARMLLQGYWTVLGALFQTPDPEAGNVRTADHWLHTPVAWIRFHHFHHTARRELYFPDETGPDHTDWGHMRTTVFFRTSDDDWNGKVHTDMWRRDDQTEPPMSPPVVWTEVTVFQRSEPEVTVEQEAHDKAAREAKALPRRNEPIKQQRAQHNLTHLPYRSWCERCVRAKGKERQSKRNTDRQPVIQIDYSFATTGTILTATDVKLVWRHLSLYLPKVDMPTA